MTTFFIIALILFEFLVIIYFYHKSKKPKRKLVKPHNFPAFTLGFPITRTAIHESGHTICAWRCTNVSKVELVEVDHFEGSVFHYNASQSDRQKLCAAVIALGGIAAELSFYKKFTSSSSKDDLRKAHWLINSIVDKEYCLKYMEALPTMDGPTLNFKKIFTEISEVDAKLLEGAYRCSKALVNSSSAQMKKLSLELIKAKKLNTNELEDILGTRIFTYRNTSKFI